MIKGLTSIFRVERLASAIRPTSQCISCVFMYVHVLTCTWGSHVAGSYVDTIPNRCPIWCAMNLRSTLRKASVEQNSVISICTSTQLRITISRRRCLHNLCDGLSNPSFSSHGQIDYYCASQLRSVAQGQTDRKTDRQTERQSPQDYPNVNSINAYCTILEFKNSFVGNVFNPTFVLLERACTMYVSTHSLYLQKVRQPLEDTII